MNKAWIPTPEGLLAGLLVLGVLIAGCTTRPAGETATWEVIHQAEQAYRNRGPETENLPNLAENATLEDVLAYAALHNPGLEAAFDRWKAALEKVTQVQTLPDPQFSYGYYIREVETRVGPQRHRFRLAQTFPWFGKLSLRGDVAFRAAEAERQRFEALRRRLVFEVRDAYHDYGLLIRTVELTQENLELVTLLENVARTRYRTDTATHADVIRAQVEIGQLDDRVRTLRDRLGPAQARLNAVLGRPGDAPLPRPRPPVEEVVTLDETALVLRLRQRNPALLALDARAHQEKSAAALAARRYYPDLGLGIEYIETGAARTPGVEDSGEDAVIATLSLNLPLWRSAYRAAEREAQLRQASAEKQRMDQANRLAARLREVLAAYRDADRKIDLYVHTLVPRAAQSLNVNQQAFAAGRGRFLEMVEAARLLLAFQLELERARATRPVRLAEIEMLAGEDLPRISGPGAALPEAASTEKVSLSPIPPAKAPPTRQNTPKESP